MGDKADVKTVIHNFQKISKIIIKKQVDLAEMEKKHLVLLLNPS
jgi:helix-turn-helix protein